MKAMVKSKIELECLMKKIFTIIAMFVSAMTVQASTVAETENIEPLRPVAKAYTIDYGEASVLDT